MERIAGKLRNPLKPKPKLKSKAFASFAIVLLACLSLLVLFAARGKADARESEGTRELIALEKKHYADLELKNAFSQALSLSPGLDEKQSSESIAESLARLQDYAQKRLAERGLHARLWFGSVGEREEKRILEETIARSKPVACAHCYVFSAMTVDWDGRPVRKSVELVFNRKISKNGFAHTPTSAEWLASDIAFGATFYWPEERMAWVTVMHEGFG